MQEPNDDQGTILRWEDHIVPILEHSDIHIRDKALVAVAWESHARPSELHQLSFRDVEDRGDHMAVLLTRPDGRERLLTLCGSIPYLKRWVQAEHPVTELHAGNTDSLEEAAPETPVWTQTRSNKRISSAQLRLITKRACKCAQVPTEFTLYDIRRSRAKQLAVQLGLGAPALRERFGWGPTSERSSLKHSKTTGSTKTSDHDPRSSVQTVGHGLRNINHASGVEPVAHNPPFAGAWRISFQLISFPAPDGTW